MRFLLEGVQYNDEQLQDSCIALFARSESPCYKYQALAYIARSCSKPCTVVPACNMLDEHCAGMQIFILRTLRQLKACRPSQSREFWLIRYNNFENAAGDHRNAAVITVFLLQLARSRKHRKDVGQTMHGACAGSSCAM